jgi:hypothetical protein
MSFDKLASDALEASTAMEMGPSMVALLGMVMAIGEATACIHFPLKTIGKSFDLQVTLRFS